MIVVDRIADGITYLLSLTAFYKNPWINWDRPLTTPWILIPARY